MFEINITLEFHRTILKFEKSVEQIYEIINTIQHSKETADVAAQISLESPHYGGFYDGDLKVSEDKEVMDNKEYSTEERQDIAVPEKEADNKGASGAINAIVGKKGSSKKQLNNIITEENYAAEDGNNNADEYFKNETGAIANETNAIDNTTEANIDEASLTKACANVCINANNEYADDDNDAKGNNGDDKIACDEPGAIDKEGSADSELSRDVTTDTGDEPFSSANKDNNPSDEEEYPDGDLELNKASREKRAKLWSWVPGYYCYKYRKR